MPMKFSGGKYREGFQVKVSLLSKEAGQVSEKTLDTLRIMINQGRPEDSFFHFQIYPHHVARAHGVTMIKADRFVKGMRKSFGITQYRMARVKKNQVLLNILCDVKNFNKVKKLLKLVNNKLPFKTKIRVEVYEKPERYSSVIR